MNQAWADGKLTRRGALKLSLAALLPGALGARGQEQGGDTLVTRLWRTDVVGRPRDRITDYENDPFIVGVEGKLRCTCGCNLDVYTCRTTDFTCGVSPAMHREVVAMVQQGKTAQEVLDAFVAKYGETVLMAPRKEGFNIAAYVVPGAAVSAVGAIIVWMLTRRSRRVAAVGVADVPGMSSEDAARVEAELSKLER